MNILRTLCGALLLAGTVSCTTESLVFEGKRAPLVFSASSVSRTMGSRWISGDQIGIYMKSSDQSLAEATAKNYSYATSGDGVFRAVNVPLMYPAKRGAVDFVAYYPYHSGVTKEAVPVDLSEQSNLSVIDLLYSNNLTNQLPENTNPVLRFKRELAAYHLVLLSKKHTDISGVKVELKQVSTKADFNLTTGDFQNISSHKQDVLLPTLGDQSERVAKALLLPGTTNLVIKLTLPTGESKEVPVATNVTFRKGVCRFDTLSITGIAKVSPTPPPSMGNYAHWKETPVITRQQLKDHDLIYINHYFSDGGARYRNYSLLFDKRLKMAYWVAYPLCNYYTTKHTSRTNAWNYDPEVSPEDQANMHKGLRGFDRGHQIPSADRVCSSAANMQTFYYTNMTPQIGRKLNQSIWSDLEEKVRNWSSNIDTLYVVTGAMPTTKENTTVTYTTDNDGKKIAVPKYYFKALAKIDRRTGKAYAIAFKLDQKEYDKKDDFMNYAIPLSKLEQITGFTFFPEIPAIDKQHIDSGQWR